jgi:hypothetical protein
MFTSKNFCISGYCLTFNVLQTFWPTNKLPVPWRSGFLLKFWNLWKSLPQPLSKSWRWKCLVLYGTVWVGLRPSPLSVSPLLSLDPLLALMGLQVGPSRSPMERRLGRSMSQPPFTPSSLGWLSRRRRWIGIDPDRPPARVSKDSGLTQSISDLLFKITASKLFNTESNFFLLYSKLFKW